MKILTLLLTLLLITTNAYAEWTIFGLGGSGSVNFYDKSTVKRNGNKIKVWTYLNFASYDKLANYLNISSMRSLQEIDCVNETLRTLSFQTFTEQDLNGDVINVPITDQTTTYIPPDSPNADLMKLVCKK